MTKPRPSQGGDRALTRCLLLYTKPAHPGRVKTRLIGELSARQAAEIHAAFLGDLAERLEGGRFRLKVAWALAPGDEVPRGLVAGAAEDVRQAQGDLGARLYQGLAEAAESFAAVAAVGSDHPELERGTVEEAFRRLEEGADAVFGPTEDGGYYLVGLAAGAVRRELFEGVPWSTGEVLGASLERCRRLGLAVELLGVGRDVDVARDLRHLAARLAGDQAACPRTRALLERWGWLEAPGGERMSRL